MNISDNIGYGANDEYFVYADLAMNQNNLGVQMGEQGATSYGFIMTPWEDASDWTTVPVQLRYTGNAVDDDLFGSIVFKLESTCDTWDYDSVIVNYQFEPVCSDIQLNTPVDNWEANLEEIGFSYYQQPDDTMMISFELGNPGFKTSRHRILLKSSLEEPMVLTLGLQSARRELLGWVGAQIATTPDGAMDPYASYEWQPLTQDRLDRLGLRGYEGPVEMRAVSHCSSTLFQEGISEFSDIVPGTVDFRRPGLFGDVLPLSGKLTPDSELRIRFDESMGLTGIDPSTGASQDLEDFDGLMSVPFRMGLHWIWQWCSDLLVSDAGVTFSESSSVRIPDGPALDWNLKSDDATGSNNLGAWSASFQVFNTSDSDGLHGTLMSIGTAAQTMKIFV